MPRKGLLFIGPGSLQPGNDRLSQAVEMIREVSDPSYRGAAPALGSVVAAE